MHTTLINVVGDEATRQCVDHHLSRLAILCTGDFKIPPHLGDLHVQPALRTQFFIYLGERNWLIARDEDFALVTSRCDQDPKPAPENSTDKSQYEHPTHRPSPSLVRADSTAKVNVRPARISAKARSLMRPPRRPTSTARSSPTSQIAPITADFVSTRSKSRS